MSKLYWSLLRKYEATGKIGNVKPYNLEHAKKIANAVALAIMNRGK